MSHILNLINCLPPVTDTHFYKSRIIAMKHMNQESDNNSQIFTDAKVDNSRIQVQPLACSSNEFSDTQHSYYTF